MSLALHDEHDDALDRRIREALDVRPSSGLHARVRARIAVEEQRGVRRTRWAWAAAAVVVAAVAGARFTTFEEPARPGVAAHQAELAVSESPAARVPESPRASAGLRAAKHSARPHQPAAPIVRVAPGEKEAFAVLLAYSRSGGLPPLPDAVPSEMDSLAVPPIDVTDVVVTPLVTTEMVEGEPQ